MSTIKQPVVWCSDPNSSNQKPTAFALHGIQLEGNITEQHLLALREIINAAAEGRLLLPSDGAIVLLDCGIGIASMVVNSGDGDKCTDRPSAVCDANAEPPNDAIASDEDVDNDAGDTNTTGDSVGPSVGPVESLPSSPSLLPPTIIVSDCDTETTKFEPKYSEFETPELSKYDYIYEFLCCAKCMNDESARHSHVDCKRVAESMAAHNETVNAMRQNGLHETAAIGCTMPSADVDRNELCQRDDIDARRHNHKRHTKPHTLNCPTKWERNGFLPIDASAKHKTRHHRNDDANESTPTTIEANELSVIDETVGRSFAVTADIHSIPLVTVTNGDDNDSPSLADPPNDAVIQMACSKNSSRKTSVDSSCTVGSMDSGFIEMQNRQMDVSAATENVAEEKAPIESSAANQRDADGASLKECSTQSSRNRRKSYEEFKAIFRNRSAAVEPDLPLVQENELTVPNVGHSQKEKIKARRKSYEEFKALVREHYDADVTQFKRKNSRRLSWSKQKASKEVTVTPTLTETSSTRLPEELVAEEPMAADVASQAVVSQSNASTVASKDEIYKKNCKIYDKLISYGTIYDIMQKKTDIYYKVYRKYDTYMTYGTIYEILQRKSDDYEIFRRSRAASEKYTNKRVSVGDANALNDDADGERAPNFGTIYDIVQRKQSVAAKKSQSLPNGIIGAIELAKIADAEKRKSKAALNKCSKIYDIIQTESNDVDAMTTSTGENNANVINRFLVKKVNETDLIVTDAVGANDANKVDDARRHTYSEPAASFLTKLTGGAPKKAKKTNRMRRFSHILSYTQRHPSADSVAKAQLTAIESMPSAIEEVECPREASATNEGDDDMYTATINRKKCRKLSSCVGVGRPPKIAPRKQSIAPPPIPPSSSSQAIKHASSQASNDIIVTTMPNETGSTTTHCQQQTTMSLTSPSHNCLHNVHGCANSHNNNDDQSCHANGAIDANCGSNIAGAIKSNDCDKNVCSTTSTTTTATTATTTISSHTALTTTTTTSTPNKKPKSRRLSEFTRGEFLNEKS